MTENPITTRLSDHNTSFNKENYGNNTELRIGNDNHKKNRR